MATNKNTEQPQKDLKIVELLQCATNDEFMKLQSFVDLALNLKVKQDELDVMAADTLPSAILTAYISDILEPNENGDLLQVIAKTPGEQSVLDNIFKRLALPDQKIVYSLLKNGIAILRFSKVAAKPTKTHSATESKEKSSATEDILVELPGKIIPEVEVVQDTYTVFPILERERCIGYIEILNKESAFQNFNNWQNDTLNFSDVIIHSPQDFAYVKFGVSRSSKPLRLSIKDSSGAIKSYTVDVGCSLLENSYAAWKTLSILQDSIVLASLIKNAQFMLIQTEAGSASKQQIEAAKVQMKSLFEGKLSLGRDGIKQYLYPQSKPNFIYTFTQNGKGAISTQTVGGDYNPGNLFYLTPFVNQFFGGMNVPKQNFGYTEGAGGLDGGGAVEEYTKRYKTTVSRFKRLYAELIKKTINAVLESRGLRKLIDGFSVKIHRAYQEIDNTALNKCEAQLRLYESTVNFLGLTDADSILKLKLIMLKQVFTDQELLAAIQTAVGPEQKKKVPEEADAAESSVMPGGDAGSLDDILNEPATDEEVAENSGEDEELTADVENTTLPEISEVLTDTE